MSKSTTLAGAALLALSFTSAQAQTDAPQLTMDKGFYIGAAAGRARGENGCAVSCENRDTTWQGYVGYRFHRYFALEAAYNDFGTVASGGTIFGGAATAEVETTAVEVSALGIAPLTEKFSVYGKIAMFRYKSKATSTGTVTGSTTAHDAEFSIGLGMQYAFTPHIGARLEWQRYNDVGSGIQGLSKDDLVVWRLGGWYRF